MFYYHCKMLRVLVVIKLLCLSIVYGQYTSPCPNIFEYVSDDNGMYGVIHIQPFETVKSLIVKINLTVSARLATSYVGSIEPIGSEMLLLESYNRGEPISYRVNFPVTNPLPRLTMLTVNDRVLCYGQGDVPGPNQYVTTISLQHILYYRGGGGANVIYAQNTHRPQLATTEATYSIIAYPETQDFNSIIITKPASTTRPRPPPSQSNWENPPQSNWERPPPDRWGQSPPRGRPPPPPPEYGRPPPDYGRPPPDYGRPPPDYGRPPPNNGRPPPEWSRPPPPPSWEGGPPPRWEGGYDDPPPRERPPTDHPPPPKRTQAPKDPEPTQEYQEEPDTPAPTKKPKTTPRPSTQVQTNDASGNSCGVNGVDSVPLVYRGVSYERGKWPWLVAIFKRKYTGLGYICAGTLVSDRHVVTAAHCMQRKNSYTASKDIVVRLGVYNLDDWTDETVVIRNLENAAIHESYNSTTLANDLLVLTLDRAVEYSLYIKAACLWSGNNDLNAIVESSGVVAGWGASEAGPAGRGEPRMVRMPIVSTTTCRASKLEFHKLTSSKTLCAGDRNGAGPCLGDSGGGLYILDSNTGRWRLRGIVSISLWSQTGEDTCNLNDYIVFTDTAQYLPWIKSAMS